MQGDRYVCALRRCPEQAIERIQAGGFHRLYGRLHDQRRAQFDSGGDDRLEREIVDDVERRNAITPRERVFEDRLGGNDRHSSTFPFAACPLRWTSRLRAQYGRLW